MVRWQDEVKSFARMLFPAFIMFVASMPCSGLADNILIGGTGYWSPYCYSNSDNGSNLQGFTVDVVKYVFRNKGNVKFVKLPWKRCLRMLDGGQLDLVMDGSKNSDRLQKYLFSDQLYHLDSVFFYNRFRYPRGLSIKNIAEVGRYTLGGISGFNYLMYPFDVSKVQKGAANIQALLEMLKYNRFDLALGFKQVVLSNAKINGLNMDGIGWTSMPEMEPLYFYIFGNKTKRCVELIHVINKGIIEMKMNGKYKELRRKYRLSGG